jgi:hypothetical protein
MLFFASLTGAVTPFAASAPILSEEAVDPDWQPIPVKCGGKRATQVGTSGKDKLVGFPGRRDVLVGLGGADTLKGLSGNDILCGGKGRDKLKAGKGKNDRCIGGKNADAAKACEAEKGI